MSTNASRLIIFNLKSPRLSHARDALTESYINSLDG